MDSLIPVATGGFGSGAGAAGVGGAIGGLIGSWFGNGWSGGWGNRGWGNGGCCDGHGFTAGAELTSNASIMNQLSSIQDTINSGTIADLQAQNSTNMAMCQGFSGIVNNDNQNTATLNNTTVQGFAGLNNAVTTGNASIQQSLSQGFNGLNTAVLVSSKDNALLNCQSTGAITKAISDCCCETQRTTMSEAAATRSMMAQIERDELLRELSDAKCKISSLQNQKFTAEAIAVQTNQIRNEMNANTATLIQHMATIAARYAPTTTPTTAG